jgi:hypothetical protein
MKYQIHLGVVCFSRKTFDYRAAGELYQRILDDLQTIESVNFEIIPELLIEIEETRNAAELLATKHLDGVICISGTFHLGHLIL